MARSRPFRLRVPVQPEQELHEAVAELCDRLIAPPAFWFFYPAGAVQLTNAQVAKLARMGLKRGLPDLWVLHGLIYGIELKRRGGTLSRTFVKRTRRGSPRVYLGQKEVFPLLEAAGMQPIAVCYSVDEVVATLEDWGVPLRGRLIGPGTRSPQPIKAEPGATDMPALASVDNLPLSPTRAVHR
jgi:hypothetical protein